MINLNEKQEEVREWVNKNFPNGDKLHPVLGVCEEAGELCHSVLKQEQGIRINEDHSKKMQDAIGDIVIYLMDVCNKYDFSFSGCILLAWDEIKRRDM